MDKNKEDFLDIEELSKMNIFESLWNSCKDHLDDTIITYRADMKVDDLTKRPIVHQITYKELIQNIIRTYYSLKERLGVKKGDIITYSSITTPELIYTAYASALIGSIFKPIDIRFKSDEILKQFEQTPSKVFFGAKPFLSEIQPICEEIKTDKIVLMSFEESLPKIVQLGAKIEKLKRGIDDKKPNNSKFIDWNEFLDKRSKTLIPQSDTTSKDGIHLTATTGTTGAPKQLLHSSENWNAQLYNARNCGLKFIRGERFFNCTVPWVDFGLINAIHTFLCSGVIIDMDPLWTDERNADYLIKNNPEWWMGAPGWLDKLFTDKKYENADLSHARYYITGGAPLYPHKHNEYQKKLSKMSERGIIAPGYGYSEVSAAATLDLENKETTIGRMWPLVDAEIRDFETGKVLEDGIEGELWISSTDERLSQIAIEYYNNPKATQEIFVTDENGKRWAKSGDKIVKNPDGTYSFRSRYKNILTYNGYNINCEKMAESIQKNPKVRNVVIFGSITEDGNQMPVICIEPINTDINTDELKDEIYYMISQKFPEYYKPIDIVFYDQFPKVSMKTDIQSIKKSLLNTNGEYIPKEKEKSLILKPSQIPKKP